jgi:hypothetical protein
MPDVGDLVTATLTITPFGVSTAATIAVYKPDGTTATASSPATADAGATWTSTYTVDLAGWWLEKWTVTGTGAGIEYNRVFVPVVPVYGEAPAYASLERFKNRLGITASDGDDELTEALDSASREIDTFCGRRFYADTAATARRFRLRDACTAVIDDVWDTTGLIVATDDGSGIYATTLVLDTDFILEPLEGVVDGSSGWPYWQIRLLGGRRFYSYTNRPPLRVTAKWGWSKIPRPVTQACLIMAQANYKLKDVAFGAAGIGDLGIVTVRQVPAAMTKLAPYVRDPVRAA